MNNILPYKNIYPKIDKNVFIAPGTIIIGDVTIGSGSSIWHNSVIRGDVASIKIGKNSNIQDGSIIHVSRDGGDCIIGDNVTVGHRVVLHACNLRNLSFIGMGAIILDGAIVESGAMVAAGSLVTRNKHIPLGEIWAGSPAKFFRYLTREERNHIETSANNYVLLAQEYNNLTVY